MGLNKFTIEKLNEQIIGEFGFTVAIEQGLEVGELGTGQNGAIGFELEYADPNGVQWVNGVPDEGSPPLDYLKTGPGEVFEFYPGDLEDAEPVDQDQSQSRGLIPNNSYISPAWINESRQFNLVRNRVDGVSHLNNVDIVMTSDKSLWSRCLIVETASPFYYSVSQGLAVATEGGARSFDVRQSPSVGKEADADGRPIPDGERNENGSEKMGLNIFFGENSVYRDDNPSTLFFDANYVGDIPRGGDMMFNPSSTMAIETSTFSLFNFYLGGQHMIYVTDEEYDEGEGMRQRLDPEFGTSELRKVRALDNVTWAGIFVLPEGTSMNSYADGLIPNDVVMKLRVDSPYEVEEGTGEFGGYPTYNFTIGDAAPSAITSELDMAEALKAINVVPNPYLGYSAYETSQFTNTVKITNLPANSTVTIYSLDGRFIRQYVRNEAGAPVRGNNRAISEQQVSPALEWDLKNNKGIPIASGVYLMHIDAPGLGERVLKWFGVQRQFDPSGL